MKRVIPTPLNILSLGVGVQSTTLYYMSALGEIQRFDYAIFADPGREKRKTYETLKTLVKWGKNNNGPPIIICGKKSLYNDLMQEQNNFNNHSPTIPAFTNGATNHPAILRRKCTEEYKIREVFKAIRRIYGISSHKWTPPTYVTIGITIDESARMKIPQNKWETLVYPFCGYKVSQSNTDKIVWPHIFSRLDCINWLKKNGFEVPVSSSCTFCPFQSDQSWTELKKDDPNEFNSIVNLDKSIRDSTLKGIRQPIYLHKSLKPLDKVHFQNSGSHLFSQCDSGFCNT